MYMNQTSTTKPRNMLYTRDGKSPRASEGSRWIHSGSKPRTWEAVCKGQRNGGQADKDRGEREGWRYGERKFSIRVKKWRLYPEGPGGRYHVCGKNPLFGLVGAGPRCELHIFPMDRILAGPSKQAWKKKHYIWMTNCDTRKTSSQYAADVNFYHSKLVEPLIWENFDRREPWYHCDFHKRGLCFLEIWYLCFTLRAAELAVCLFQEDLANKIK